MRILFAVSNENVSDAIVKSYHKNNSDTITFKNVFYFNAIIKEIQRDRSYDRIIISEDLEPFANNNYDAIDKFIYERLESISEEINDFADTRIPIILICTDRRTKSSAMIQKLYNIGIYDALIGSDRRIDNVCKLINTPRSKEEAQQYYKLENSENTKSALEDVSEEEVRNIVNYYKKLGKNEERYTDSFNNIAAQYTDAQLKIIIRYLPINVKAVLEAECPKYQELVTYANNREQLREQREKEKLQEQKLKEKEEYEQRIKEQYEQKKKEEEKAKLAQKKSGYVPNAEHKNAKQQQQAIGIDLIDRRMNKPGIQGDVLIPNAINTRNAKKVLSDEEMNMDSARTIRPESIKSTVQASEPNRVVQPVNQQPTVQQVQPNIQQNVPEEEAVTLPGFEDIDTATDETMQNVEVNSVPKQETQQINQVKTVEQEQVSQMVKPVQQVPQQQAVSAVQEQQSSLPEVEKEEIQVEQKAEEPVKRGRGRPRKYPVDTTPKPKGKRGRPRKNPLPEETETTVDTVENKEASSAVQETPVLPGLEDLEVEIPQGNDDSVTLPGFENENISEDFSSFDTFETPQGKTSQNSNEYNNNNINASTSSNTNNNVSNVQEQVSSSSATLPGFEDDEFEDIELPSTNTAQSSSSVLDDDFMSFNSTGNNTNNTQINTQGNNQESQQMNSQANQNIQPESVVADKIDDEITLPGMDLESHLEMLEEEPTVSNNTVEPVRRDETTLPGFEEDFEDIETKEQERNVEQVQETEPILPGFEDDTPELTTASVSTATSYRNNDAERNAGIRKLEEKRVYSTGTLESVLTPDKKIAAFIGTSKNGTSFIVNNLASLFSSIGVKTAILDMTKNRNAYYIYTNNDENLRQISYDAIDKLENGVAEGIKVDRNLEVYTAVPNEEKDFSNAEAILTTLAKTQSLVLIDCDFDTPLGYFANAQEIYLVQSMDILTIQPLTAFLRELKTNGILDQEKLRVVVNKEIRVRGLTSKTIIGGMSFYNDPSMSYMTELFNKDKIKACTLPFEDSTYSKYLETLVNCNVSISGYSKSFMNSLKILGNMVYPLLSKQTYIKTGPDYTRSNFSDEMNNTLNQMRNKY